ncbi:MAG: hypothetical protein FWE36_06130 [Erysipelotrichales bacterium]|nr:hypothetical protein [Erysipelotrichales bacterium]
MDCQSKNKQPLHIKQKFIVSLALPIFLLFYTIPVTIVFFLFILPAWEGEVDSGLIILLFMLVILPWLLTFIAIKLFWPIVEIDEKGVKRSLFGVFFKRNISWEEMYEIRVIGMFQGGAWLFFSKKSLAGMSHGKARRQKEQIQIVFTAQLLGTIRFYSDKEIIGIPEDKVIELISKIKNYNLIKNRTLNMEASKEVVPEKLDEEEIN